MKTHTRGRGLTLALVNLNDPIFNLLKFELLTIGDTGLQRQLAESFLKQSPKSREDLVLAAQSDGGQFDQAIHRLKGSCHFTAADRLLGLLRSVENVGETTNQEFRMRVAQAILGGLDQLETSLWRFLSESDGR
jgi:HPt (histidine-containing phosphotransfer) domain-containing protein